MEGKGMGAAAVREAIFDDAEQRLRQEQANQQPSEAQRQATRMLVDGFGPKDTYGAANSPTMTRLHDQFTKVREGQSVRVQPALSRLAPGGPRDIPRSGRKFIMDRGDRE